MHAWYGAWNCRMCELPSRLRCEAKGGTLRTLRGEIPHHGRDRGILDRRTRQVSFIGATARDSLEQLELISTHDQALGGATGQIFLGCTFPASESYWRAVHRAGWRVGEVLRDHGVLGRFGIDFVSHRIPTGWRHVAIEINLRKGGTTLPFHMLQFLTAGRDDPDAAMYVTPMGQSRCYYATDSLQRASYRRFIPRGPNRHPGITPPSLRLHPPVRCGIQLARCTVRVRRARCGLHRRKRAAGTLFCGTAVRTAPRRPSGAA